MLDLDHHIAKVGIQNGIGVEFDVNSLFKSTKACHRPDLLTMMKAQDEVDFINLKANTTGNKRKIKCYTILTPSLVSALQETDMTLTPKVVFIQTIAHIKAKTNPTTAQATPHAQGESLPTSQTEEETTATLTEPTTDKILMDLVTHFEGILHFLWDCHHTPGEVGSSNMAPLQHPETIEWNINT